MRRKISSPFTVFFKFIWPGIWLAGGLSISRALFYRESWLNGLVALILIWLPGAIHSYLKQIHLKKVSLDDQFIYISNYWEEIRVPHSEISAVRGVRGLFNMPRYTVSFRLKTASRFGERIRFVPGYYIKDVVRDLKEAIMRSAPYSTQKPM